MLRLIALAAQATLISLAGYNAVTALWGWGDRKPAPQGRRDRRMRAVIPAHDEESVIGGILSDLADTGYQASEVWVIADRCADSTASIAHQAGAMVAERSEGPVGKGAALSWFLEEHPLSDDETLVVFDADNRLPPETLSRIADEIDAGHEVVQCYLDVANPDGSLLAEASALSYWAGNRMVQLARSNLGWSADLGGTGMAFTASALAKAGGFTNSLTEDQELGARVVRAGMRVEWLHDVKVRDEKPESIGVAVQAEGPLDGRQESGSEEALSGADRHVERGIDRSSPAPGPTRAILRRPVVRRDDGAGSRDRFQMAPSLAGLGSGHSSSGSRADSIPGTGRSRAEAPCQVPAPGDPRRPVGADQVHLDEDQRLVSHTTHRSYFLDRTDPGPLNNPHISPIP